MSEAKKERYRRVRGAILKLLAHQHPAPLEAKELHFYLDDMRMTITDDELQSHLCYLAEGRLIDCEKRKVAGISVEMVRITRNGLNVLDGFDSDVGVNVEF